MTRLRSIRRHRTTPSTFRSGPVSTIFANSARWSGDRRGVGPSVQLSKSPSGPSGVKPVNPVAQGLAIHAADLGRLAAIHSIANRRKRQKPPALIDVLGPPGNRPKLLSRIVVSQFHRCGHGANPPTPTESETSRQGNPPMSQTVRPLVLLDRRNCLASHPGEALNFSFQ